MAAVRVGDGEEVVVVVLVEEEGEGGEWEGEEGSIRISDAPSASPSGTDSSFYRFGIRHWQKGKKMRGRRRDFVDFAGFADFDVDVLLFWEVPLLAFCRFRTCFVGIRLRSNECRAVSRGPTNVGCLFVRERKS